MLRLGILTIFLLFVFAGHAQIKADAGVRAGYNFATFTGLKNSNLATASKNGFVMAGAFAQLTVLKKIGLRAEISYNPKGALVEYYDSSHNVNVEAVRKLSYTDVTLSAMYNFKLLRIIRTYVFAGYNFENLGTVKDAIQRPYTDTKTITDNFEKKSNSIVAGVGLKLRIAKILIMPEFRYLQGLTDITKNNMVTKNQVFTVSLGIGMAL